MRNQTPGERLLHFREAEGLSMAKLAALVKPKTTASHINKLEKGQIELTMEWARRLGDGLGVHPLDFFDAMPKLPPQENALIELYRGLSETDRATVFRVTDAMSQQRASIADAGPGPLKKR